MTNPTSPTQAAAERLRRVADGELLRAVYNNDSYALQQYNSDAQNVAQAYLALLPDWEKLNDSMPLSRLWLSRAFEKIDLEWEWAIGESLRLRQQGDGQRYILGGYFGEFGFDDIAIITECGQLRSLCRSLSIECKE